MSANLTASLPGTNQRITVIDTLRGIALLGMMIVHFSYNGTYEKTGVNGIIVKVNQWLIDGRFFTMFAILFGVGFAIQLENAKRKGVNFVPRYLRRLAMLLFFGILVESLCGFNILVEYSIAGLVLLAVRNWSLKALVVFTLFIALLGTIYSFSFNTISAAKYGVERTKSMNQKRNLQSMAYWTKKRQLDSVARNTSSFSTAVVFHTKSMIHRFTDVRMLIFAWLADPILFFLIGLISVKKGVFNNPKKHRWLIIGFMTFGLASWILFLRGKPLFSLTPNMQYPNVPYSIDLILKYASYNLFYLLRYNWLTFTYIGAVLLMSAYIKKILQFRIFSSAGRMPLTFYFLQAFLISLYYKKSAFGFPTYPDFLAPVFALLLFTAMVLFSRWWLARYEYGPLEWLWRSVTYWKVQPFRKSIKTLSFEAEPEGVIEVVTVPVQTTSTV